MSDTADIAESAARDPVAQPILNTPYQEPQQHWLLDPLTLRATKKLVHDRRLSGDYLPVPKDKQDIGMLQASAESHVEPHTSINAIRDLVGDWRHSGWPGTKHATHELLVHWASGQADVPPFFCQREAVETVVWLLEAGLTHNRKGWSETVQKLRETNSLYNESIPRLALKMATGTGKTKLMQMLIAWLAASSRRAIDVLALVPGLTVKERLAEIDPSSNKEAYGDLVPERLLSKVLQARVTVMNFQAFRKREVLAVAGVDNVLTGVGKALITKGYKRPDKWMESDEQMLGRLLRSHSERKLYIFNDEAHHCYRPLRKYAAAADVEERHYEEDAALWFNALRYVMQAKRLVQVFDLSATPMYLRKPVELPSVIFPWTVSDYPLIEAIEAGLTKIPRLPSQDDSNQDKTVYRNLYELTEPKDIKVGKVQNQITTLLEQMHEHYQATVDPVYRGAGKTPVMIVVANSVANATSLFQHISGYRDDEGHWHPGAYELFSNVRSDGRGPVDRPPTLLVHSALDEPKSMTSALQAILATQTEIHTPNAKGKSERIKLVREIFNTVGVKNKPGEYIRCVISVSMLTEGWDTRTVTQILGYRKFGTQLICEQVAGRGLRKTNFEPKDESGLLAPEFVEIYGIPFQFLRRSSDEDDPGSQIITPIEPYRVYSMPDRADERRIVFPNVASYMFEEPRQQFSLDPAEVKTYETSVKHTPTTTEVAGTLGPSHISELTERRRQFVIYRLAAVVVEKLSNDGARRRQLFGSAVQAVADWLAHPLVACADLRQLLLDPHLEIVPHLIAICCRLDDQKKQRIIPVFADHYDRGLLRCLDTGNVDFWTTKRLYHDTARSELNRAPCDSHPEVLVAQALDELDGIAAWVRNFRLGWRIPYLDLQLGIWRNYEPDFVARLEKLNDMDEPVNLVIEYKGQPGIDSRAKTAGIRDWWIPAVSGSNESCCRGEWRYVYIEELNAIRPTLIAEIERTAEGRSSNG